MTRNNNGFSFLLGLRKKKKRKRRKKKRKRKKKRERKKKIKKKKRRKKKRKKRKKRKRKKRKRKNKLPKIKILGNHGVVRNLRREQLRRCYLSRSMKNVFQKEKRCRLNVRIHFHYSSHHMSIIKVLKYLVLLLRSMIRSVALDEEADSIPGRTGLTLVV